jgi:hypothetical protein
MYSKAGYRDGARFFSDKQDPRLVKAMQMVQQLTEALKGKQMEMQRDERMDMAKIASNEKIKGAEIQVDSQRIAGDLRIRESEAAIEGARLELERFIASMEGQGMQQDMMVKMREMSTRIQEAGLRLQEQRIKNEGAMVKVIGDLRRQNAEANERRIAA